MTETRTIQWLLWPEEGQWVCIWLPEGQPPTMRKDCDTFEEALRSIQETHRDAHDAFAEKLPIASSWVQTEISPRAISKAGPTLPILVAELVVVLQD